MLQATFSDGFPLQELALLPLYFCDLADELFKFGFEFVGDLLVVLLELQVVFVVERKSLDIALVAEYLLAHRVHLQQ
jgi:hypothetical protein